MTEEEIEGCDRILNDEFSDYSERSLYMIGKIDEAQKNKNNNKNKKK